MGKKTQSIEKKRSSSLPGIVFCTLVIALASVVLQTRNSPPLNEYLSKEISPNKPYETFEEFYPHYLDEHSQQTTRQWHYVGTSLFLIYMLCNPLLVLPILAAGLTAYSSIPFFRHLSNGLPEMGLFMMVYIIGGKLITRSFKKTFIPVILGYSFAWIGHFFFEHNKPATFIYPSFSLMGDFHMVYDAIRSLA
ncbi:unnamed protein product [Adineta steineri]|uniref:Transmembrane protein n=1 Tax=Adineta steineri TaxID=433720 RepID=A0A814XWM4_9BILA|nr:unnamed protein product [Adineta steineri]CAF3780690.1 unnamed protein product [Adineta steineri]